VIEIAKASIVTEGPAAAKGSAAEIQEVLQNI
jgi:hypothetical protein